MKKNITRVISCLIVLVLTISSLGIVSVSASDPGIYDGTSVSASLAGEGTEASPFLIGSGADLAYFAKNPVAGAYYKQTADIYWSAYVKGADALAASNWTPIANFNGTYDGDGHFIAGIYIKSAEEEQALFKTLIGTLKNLTLKDSYISGTRTVGGLVASAGTSTDIANPAVVNIENCVNYATIEAAKGAGFRGVGGVLGMAFSNSGADERVYCSLTVKDCANYGDVITTGGNSYSAGVVGRVIAHPAVITGCANFGNIISSSAIAGGVVGQILFGTPIDGYTVTISDCFNAGSVSGTYYVGGIAGRAYENTTVTNCVNVGSVCATNSSKQNFGAIDAHNKITSSNTYAIQGSASNTGDPTVVSNGDLGVQFVTSEVLNSAATAALLGDKWLYNSVDGLMLVAFATEADNPGSGDSAMIVVCTVLATAAVLGSALVVKKVAKKEN